MNRSDEKMRKTIRRFLSLTLSCVMLGSLVGCHSGFDFLNSGLIETSSETSVEGMYVINFDANGGQMEYTKMTISNGSFVVLPIPTKSGYEFDGWYFGTMKVSDGVLDFPGTVTLTAKWISDSFIN